MPQYLVVRDNHNMMQTQQNVHIASIAAGSGRAPTEAANAVFDVLMRIVSHATLKLLKKQLLFIAVADDYKDAEACIGRFTSKNGLPFKHYLHHKIHELCAIKYDSNVFYIILLAAKD